MRLWARKVIVCVAWILNETFCLEANLSACQILDAKGNILPVKVAALCVVGIVVLVLKAVVVSNELRTRSDADQHVETCGCSLRGDVLSRKLNLDSFSDVSTPRVKDDNRFLQLWVLLKLCSHEFLRVCVVRKRMVVHSKLLCSVVHTTPCATLTWPSFS